MRSGRLAEAIKSLRGKDRDMHALVVLRHCKVVIELYAEKRHARSQPCTLFRHQIYPRDVSRRAAEKWETTVVGGIRGRCRGREHDA
jgi:hypothetical protein